MHAALHRENGVHDVEGRARGDARVVEDLDRQGGRVHLLAVQAEWRRDDVERPRDAGGVHKDDGSAVRGRVVERGDPAFPPRRSAQSRTDRWSPQNSMSLLVKGALSWRETGSTSHAALE